MTNGARVAALEASGRAALPALMERRAGDWLLRVSGGDTKRVNSVNPISPDARPDPVWTEAEALYAKRDLPCRFRLTPLAHADADRALAEAGYARIDESWTMTAPLVARPLDQEVLLSARPDPAWLARIAPLSDRSPTAVAIQARLLAAIPVPLALAAIEVDGTTVASGYASIGHGRAQLSDIVVAPHARGRGLGRRLVAGLLGWAHDQGCGEAMLQVLAANRVARALYRSLGFIDAYCYHYRVR